MVAGVAGLPAAKSLSPLIHGAWIEAAGLDAAYVAIEPSGDAFAEFVRRRGPIPGFAGAHVRGFNVTIPFKEQALALADQASERARRAGAANLLLYRQGGIWADNTDGVGLLAAFAEQAPGFDPAAGPVVILGAGGAARGAAAAFLDAGAPVIRLVNRSAGRAASLAAAFGECVAIFPPEELKAALADANAVINATPVAPDLPLAEASPSMVVMDMVYRPLVTPLLANARAAGLRTVDGLAMLIGQARPSFSAFFGVKPPDDVDVRARAIDYLNSEASRA
jgi:shikimate dehydrogenase